MITRFDCPHCGAEIVVDGFHENAATKCNICQHEVEIPAAPRNTSGQLSGRDYQPTKKLASRTNRLAARLIDLGIYVLATFVAGLFWGFMTGAGDGPLTNMLGWMIWGAITVYQFYLLTSYGQTIGKQLMKIRIVKHDTGENGGFVTNVLVREIVNGILALIPFYALVDVLFIYSSEQRCIHDRFAGTDVIEDVPVPQPRPQRQPHQPTIIGQ